MRCYQIPCNLSQFVLPLGMDLIWVMFGFFVFITIVFVTLGIFFPEWMGITGKKAKEIQDHHSADAEITPPNKPLDFSDKK